MNANKSDRCWPRDWALFLSWQSVPIVSLLVVAFLLRFVRGTRQGDPTFVWVSLILAVIGVILLFIARLPLYRQRKFFTFGSKALPAGHRKVYRIAYGFLGVSVVMMLSLLLVLR